METAIIKNNIESDIRMIKFCVEQNNDLCLPISVEDLLKHVEEISISDDYSLLFDIWEKVAGLSEYCEMYDKSHNNGENRLEIFEILKATLFLRQKMDKLDSEYQPRAKAPVKTERIGYIRRTDIDEAQEWAMRN